MNSLILPTIGLSGRYKLQTLTESNIVTKEVDWFPNLITNTGLDEFGVHSTSFLGSILDRCVVGSGNNAPAVTDSALQSQVASTDTTFSIATSVDTPGRYLSQLVTYEFGVGVAAGNLSELGVGYQDNTLFSRALILDGSLNPTTITVLATEKLRVTYEFRVNIPTGNFGPQVVDGYTIDIKAAGASSYNQFTGWYVIVGGSAGARSVYVGDSGVGATIDDLIPNLSYVGNVSAVGNYVLGSHKRAFTKFIDTGSGNININAIAFGGGPSYWQASISPTINKTSLYTLAFDWEVSWARA